MSLRARGPVPARSAAVRSNLAVRESGAWSFRPKTAACCTKRALSCADPAVVMRPRLLSLIGCVLLGWTTLAARDWPQYLGPNRDGVYSGPPLADAWPSGGPRVVWKRDVGQGFSGPVAAAGRVILFHRVAGREVVEALDPASGASRWRY